MGDYKSLTELQLAMLRVLWERGEASVAEVHDSVHAERGLAPTTIATVLSRLERDGIVTHRTKGRQYVYRALVSRATAQRSMVQDLVSRLFNGDPSALVSYLLKESEMEPGDLDKVRALIEEAERQREADRGEP